VTALADRNARLGLKMALVALAMVGLAFASVPLYRMFCQVTGFAGTTQRAAEAPGAVAGTISVRFDANIDPALPWKFEPVQEKVRIHPGERTTIVFVRGRMVANLFQRRDRGQNRALAGLSVVARRVGHERIEHCLIQADLFDRHRAVIELVDAIG